MLRSADLVLAMLSGTCFFCRDALNAVMLQRCESDADNLLLGKLTSYHRLRSLSPGGARRGNADVLETEPPEGI